MGSWCRVDEHVTTYIVPLTETHFHVVVVSVSSSLDGLAHFNVHLPTRTFKVVNGVTLVAIIKSSQTHGTATIESNQDELVLRVFSIAIVFLGTIVLHKVILSNLDHDPVLTLDRLAVIDKGHDAQSDCSLIHANAVPLVGKPSHFPMILRIKALVRKLVSQECSRHVARQVSQVTAWNVGVFESKVVTTAYCVYILK